MKHIDCGGLVLYDSLYQAERFIDLSCLMCGRRWFVRKNNPLARYVMQTYATK